MLSSVETFSDSSLVELVSLGLITDVLSLDLSSVVIFTGFVLFLVGQYKRSSDILTGFFSGFLFRAGTVLEVELDCRKPLTEGA